MIQSQTPFRVRYVETDLMGIVNNAHYPTYFEMGRADWFRQLGIEYAEIERNDIMLPVNELWVKYFKPAYFDEDLIVRTILREMPVSRLRFDYEIVNHQGELLTTGYTILAMINAQSRRPTRCPEFLKLKLEPYFQE